MSSSEILKHQLETLRYMYPPLILYYLAKKEKCYLVHIFHHDQIQLVLEQYWLIYAII